MKKIIGLTAISLALGAATFGSVASAQWGGGWDNWDNEGTTVVVRCGDNDRFGNWNRCGFNRCGFNRCGFNRCFDRCGFGGGWGGGWDGIGGWGF